MVNKSIPLGKEAKAWLKRKNGRQEIIRVVPSPEDLEKISVYQLYTAFDLEAEFLGSILFDREGYWIYDGEWLAIDEQEQVAAFIINYQERL